MLNRIVIYLLGAAALAALVAVFRRTSAWARAAASRAAKRPTQGRPLPCRCSDGGGMPLLAFPSMSSRGGRRTWL